MVKTNLHAKYLGQMPSIYVKGHCDLWGGHKVGEKKFHEFSRIFHSHNYTFPEVIATKIFAIWQHLGQLLAIFSLHMHRNGF